jgi:hypothetical protein
MDKNTVKVTAVTGFYEDGSSKGRITSAYGSTIREAQHRLVEQLLKPGRKSIFYHWQEAGCLFIVNDDDSLVLKSAV